MTDYTGYINEKIKAFEGLYHPAYSLNTLASSDAGLRSSWKRDRAKSEAKQREIRTNDDVISLIDRFDDAVDHVDEYMQSGPGCIEDAYDMYLAAYNAIRGLRKLAQFTDPFLCFESGFSELSEDEVDQLFDRMNDIAKRMDALNMRRAMQD